MAFLDFLGPISDLVGTVMTNKSNRKQQKSANEANAALWREQAAYNSPTNQMTRLSDAGLNPNLVYGQIADSKMSSPPKMEAARIEKPASMKLAEHQQVVNMQEQNKLIRSQNNATVAQANKLDAETDYITHENSIYKHTGTTKNEPAILKNFRFLQNWYKNEEKKKGLRPAKDIGTIFKREFKVKKHPNTRR